MRSRARRRLGFVSQNTPRFAGATPVLCFGVTSSFVSTCDELTCRTPVGSFRNSPPGIAVDSVRSCPHSDLKFRISSLKRHALASADRIDQTSRLGLFGRIARTIGLANHLRPRPRVYHELPACNRRRNCCSCVSKLVEVPVHVPVARRFVSPHSLAFGAMIKCPLVGRVLCLELSRFLRAL